MPLTSERSAASLRFGTSVVAELLFLLRSLAAGEATGAKTPAALVKKVRSFWGDETLFWELFVIAEAAGALLGASDSSELASLLRPGFSNLETSPPLASESEEDRLVIQARLARLRRDSRLQERYLKLLSEVWSHFEGDWSTRRGELERVAAECQRRHEAGTSWQQLLQGGDTSPAVAEAGWERARFSGAAVGICAYGGSLVIDLPSTQLFAMSVKDGATLDRSLAETLARRLRTLSDPTRLSLVRLVASSPRTVGDLALSLGISQPTVSNHVKVLREAGLLATSSSGERRELRLADNAVGRLLRDIEGFATGE